MDGCLMLTLAAAYMLDQGCKSLGYVSIEHLHIPADILKQCQVRGEIPMRTILGFAWNYLVR